jgi:hypothetical protein
LPVFLVDFSLDEESMSVMEEIICEPATNQDCNLPTQRSRYSALGNIHQQGNGGVHHCGSERASINSHLQPKVGAAASDMTK